MASCSFLAFSTYSLHSFSQFFLSPFGGSFLLSPSQNFVYSFICFCKSVQFGIAVLSSVPTFLCNPFLVWLIFFMISSIEGFLSSAAMAPATMANRTAAPVRIRNINSAPQQRHGWICSCKRPGTISQSPITAYSLFFWEVSELRIGWFAGFQSLEYRLSTES